MWIYNSVAMWIYNLVAMWIYNSVAIWNQCKLQCNVKVHFNVNFRSCSCYFIDFFPAQLSPGCSLPAESRHILIVSLIRKRIFRAQSAPVRFRSENRNNLIRCLFRNRIFLGLYNFSISSSSIRLQFIVNSHLFQPNISFSFNVKFQPQFQPSIAVATSSILV